MTLTPSYNENSLLLSCIIEDTIRLVIFDLFSSE
ncbi:hypothetical protein T11_15048 [Trichinella zimbabwensis]|uniref:Uncharacterized protein n=1 Tax=Trichinella zimbabwensis TaxID=268475 RepID=A0A0V1GDJ5_9BILA|nr:hypothetical protein T11_15048 [Trichinella zimbabwensis]